MGGAPKNRHVVILMMFGTAVEHALPGLLCIRDRVTERFPHTPVRMVFTSSMIRRKWRERAADPDYRKFHPKVPEEILTIRGPEEELRLLRAEGPTACVLQPVSMAPSGEEELNIFTRQLQENAAPVNGEPDSRLLIGRPALGSHGARYPYRRDVVRVVRALSGDAAWAANEKAALFYLGHGNRSPLTDAVYREVVAEFRRQYPEIFTVMSLIEGAPSMEEAMDELKARRIVRVLLKPFMITAGGHVQTDMAGDRPGSLQFRLESEGFRVLPVMSGLGETGPFAEIFAQHVADAARDGGIELT